MKPTPGDANVEPGTPLLTREIDGDFVLYDPQSDAVHTLNETARFIWERRTKTPEQIARALQAHYRVPLDTAKKDVDLILKQFKKLGLKHKAARHETGV